jgi:hypothetical protein
MMDGCSVKFFTSGSVTVIDTPGNVQQKFYQNVIWSANQISDTSAFLQHNTTSGWYTMNEIPPGCNYSTPTFPGSGTISTNGNPYKIRVYFLTAGSSVTFKITDSGGHQSSSIPVVAGQEITLDAGAGIFRQA